MKLPRLTRILARRPAQNLNEGLTTRSWLGAPDINKALAQYDAYIEAFRQRGIDVNLLNPDTRHPDGHYVEDPAVIYDDLLFVTRPGAAARAGETQQFVAELPVNFPRHKIVMIEDPDAHIEGGDVLFTADRVLIGISERTNLAGAQALKAALLDYQSDAKVDFVPLSGVLHLKTGMTELVPGVLLADPAMKTDYTFDFAEVITLPAEQGYAANVVPMNDDFVLISKGFPIVAEHAAKYYSDVVELDMSEFEKMDGSLTCLSLRY